MKSVDRKTWISVGTICLSLSMPASAWSQSGMRSIADLEVDELKAIYLACNDALVDQRLGSGGIAQCSIVYEALKARAFGGDFGRLLEWSSAHPTAPHAASQTGRVATVERRE